MSKTKTTLAEKCRKVQATIKTYSGIKADTEAKRELADNKNADETLVNVSKHLFDRDFLREPTKIGKQFRNNVIYKRTLPWIDADDRVLGEGTSYVAGTHRRVKGGEWRLLPAEHIEWFEQQVKEYRKRFFDEVDKIIDGYEDAIEEAEQRTRDAEVGSASSCFTRHLDRSPRDDDEHVSSEHALHREEPHAQDWL